MSKITQRPFVESSLAAIRRVAEFAGATWFRALDLTESPLPDLDQLQRLLAGALAQSDQHRSAYVVGRLTVDDLNALRHAERTLILAEFLTDARYKEGLHETQVALRALHAELLSLWTGTAT